MRIKTIVNYCLVSLLFTIQFAYAQSNAQVKPKVNTPPTVGHKAQFKKLKPTSQMPAPMATYTDTIDDHFTICEDNIIEFNGGSQGYLNGTTGNEFLSVPGENGETDYYYIREHGLLLNVAAPIAPANTAKVKGMYVAFGQRTKRVGVADSFFVNIYDMQVNAFGNNEYIPVGKQGFTLSDFPNPPTNFQYISFNSDVFVSGLTMFSLQTRTQFSNDTLTFPLTSPTTQCGESKWFINIADSETHEALDWFKLNELNFGPDFDTTILGNPLFVPVIEYYQGPPLAYAGGDAFSFCNETIQLNGSSNLTTGVKYHWEPAEYLDDPNSATPTATMLGTTTFTLTVTEEATGLTATDEVIITVFSGIPADAGADKTVGCGESVTLGPQDILFGYDYKWTPATYLNDASAPQPVATPLETTTYTLKITNADGCFAVASVKVTVTPIPITVLSETGQTEAIIECGQSINLKASADTGMDVAFSWLPTTGLSDPNAPATLAKPITSIVYTVTGSDAMGCSGSAIFKIQVDPIQVKAANADTIQMTTQSITLSDAAVSNPQAQIQWSPTTGLSDPNILNPIATPIVTTTYTITATFGDCVSKDEVTLLVVNNLNGELGQKLELFPNPAHNQFSIRAAELMSDLRLEIFSLEGRLCLSQILTAHKQQWNIDISDLSRGAYIVKLSNAKHTAHTKLIVR